MVSGKKPKITKKDEQAQAIINECLNHAAMYFEDRDRNWELFEGVRRRKEERQTKHDQVYRSHIGAKAVEQLATFATQALTNEGGKIFTVSEYNNVETARQAAGATKLLNYYMSNLDVTQELYKTLFEAECFGTGIMEVEYRTVFTKKPKQDGNTIKISVDEDGNFGAIRSNKYEMVPHLKQPWLRQVRLQDFWVDRMATCLEDMRYACIRCVLSYEDVKKFERKYGLKKLKEAKENGFPTRSRLKSDSTINEGHRKRDTEYDVESILQYNESSAGDKNPKVELIKIYRPGTVQFVMNDIVISEEIQLYPGIRYPFAIFRNDPKPGEFYGRSTIELLRNDIQFNEQLTSLIHDGYQLNLKPVFLADANAFMVDQLEEYKNAGAGDIVAINGLNIEAIREVKGQAPDPSTVAFAQKFEQDAKNAVGINPIMDGGQDISSGVRTQGSFELVSRMGSTRLQNKIKIYAKAFEDIGRLVLQMAKIFSDGEEYVAITGALGDTVEQWVDPREIDTRVKFKVKLGQIADPARATKAVQMMNWAQQVKGMDEFGLFRSYAAMAEASAIADLFEDPTMLFETNPEVIAAAAELKAGIAGIDNPSASLLGSPSSIQQQQQAQQPQQDPNAQPQPADPAQASDVPQITEGN